MVGIVSCVFAKGAVVFLRAGQTKATHWVAFFFVKKLQSVMAITQRSLVSASIRSYVTLQGEARTRIGFPGDGHEQQIDVRRPRLCALTRGPWVCARP
jgi:hypothetical protein